MLALTPQNEINAVAALKKLTDEEILLNPDNVKHDRWDYHDYSTLLKFAEKRQWKEFTHYLRNCYESYVIESVVDERLKACSYEAVSFLTEQQQCLSSLEVCKSKALQNHLHQCQMCRRYKD